MTFKYCHIRNFEILNESPDSIDNIDGKIVIRTSCGSMWGKGNTSKNILLTRTSFTEVQAEVVVEISPQNDGEQAGIVLFQDSDNYIKFIREMVGGEQTIILVKEIDGSPQVMLNEPFLPTKVNLKISKKLIQPLIE